MRETIEHLLPNTRDEQTNPCHDDWVTYDPLSQRATIRGNTGQDGDHGLSHAPQRGGKGPEWRADFGP
jgi:hypothetical protein